MSRTILLVLLLFTSSILQAQITFEPGEITDTTGHTSRCLIMYKEWRQVPAAIRYKVNENGTLMDATPGNTREIRINNYCRYIAFQVKIDRSSEILKYYSHQREPEWEESRIFLQILVEGKASLYYYEDNQSSGYFYSKDGSNPEQLVCKQYYTDIEGKQVNENNTFRQQLWMNLRCEGTSLKTLEELQFNRSALISYFRKYNECSNSSSIVYWRKPKGHISLGLSAGLTGTTIQANNTWLPDIKNYPFSFSPFFSAELAYILPFNRNKWELVFNPALMRNKTKDEHYIYRCRSDFKAIDFALGARYNMFLGGNNRLFVNFFYIPEVVLDLNSNISIENKWTMKLNPDYTIAFGAGYSFKRLTIEARHSPQRIIGWTTGPVVIFSYRQTSIFLKWRIF
jgi:hypothetical protein